MKKGLTRIAFLSYINSMMFDEHIDFDFPIGYFSNSDTKLFNLSTHFGGAHGWKSDNQLDKSITKLAEKS